MATLIATMYPGTPSLGTSIFTQIRDAETGTVLIARTNTGIREDIAGSGLYTWSGLVSDAFAYEAIWDENDGVYTGQIVIPPASTLVSGAVGGGNTVSPFSFVIKRGDTDPPTRIQCLQRDPSDATGNTLIPWPIPSGATVKFTMRDSADFNGATRTSFSGAPKIHATANIDDAANGILSYGWAVGDTDTDGLFRGEFEVTTLAGEIRTFPVGVDASRNWIAITITDDLDPGIDP